MTSVGHGLDRNQEEVDLTAFAFRVEHDSQTVSDLAPQRGCQLSLSAVRWCLEGATTARLQALIERGGRPAGFSIWLSGVSRRYRHAPAPWLPGPIVRTTSFWELGLMTMTAGGHSTGTRISLHSGTWARSSAIPYLIETGHRTKSHWQWSDISRERAKNR